MLRPQLTLLLLLFTAATWGQNFTFTPQNPKPGDLITFTYEPAGLLAGTAKPVECSFYQLKKEGTSATKHINADELKLIKKGNKFTGKLQTDTAASFIYFGFSSDNNFDNNNNEGYHIVLTDGEKARRGAHFALYMYYNYMGREVGLERNADKAFEALQKEIDLYPEDRKDYLFYYLPMASKNAKDSKDQMSTLVQKEIEAALKNGLHTEVDYNTLTGMYYMAKLQEQAKFIENLKKEKFPSGTWKVGEFMNKFYSEKDPEVMKAMAKEAEEKIKTDSNWKAHLNSLPDIKIRVLSLYKDRKEWDKIKQAIQEINPEMTNSVAMMYNNIAWRMQGKNESLAQAEELSRLATEHAKKEMQQPTEKKPAHQTTKQWEKSRRERYAMFADTYAMVMYRMGEYQKGFSFTREAALDIHNGNDVANNNTYALLAEKVLPVDQYKTQLENFVRKGHANKEIKEVLQRAYVKEKGSENGYDNYMAALEKEERLRMLEELRKTMLNNPAPAFALQNLNGKQVSLAGLKGKTVVVDFWATWCGPCIASFPGMQKVATKFKDNPDVVFLFVDTWESAEDKKKNAAEFIANKKLDLHVLLDEENKVVEQFKVEGVPTKFVIDKNGVIRFKSVGYGGNDDKLVTELTAMIELASL